MFIRFLQQFFFSYKVFMIFSHVAYNSLQQSTFSTIKLPRFQPRFTCLLNYIPGPLELALFLLSKYLFLMEIQFFLTFCKNFIEKKIQDGSFIFYGGSFSNELLSLLMLVENHFVFSFKQRNKSPLAHLGPPVSTGGEATPCIPGIGQDSYIQSMLDLP